MLLRSDSVAHFLDAILPPLFQICKEVLARLLACIVRVDVELPSLSVWGPHPVEAVVEVCSAHRARCLVYIRSERYLHGLLRVRVRVMRGRVLCRAEGSVCRQQSRATGSIVCTSSAFLSLTRSMWRCRLSLSLSLSLSVCVCVWPPCREGRWSLGAPARPYSR